MTDERSGILLTGSTGFLGGEVLARLVERGGRPVYALVRAAGTEEAQARLDATLARLIGGDGPAGGAIAVPGDITRPDLGMPAAARNRLAERVGDIIHCAASVSFTLGLAESRQINVYE